MKKKLITLRSDDDDTTIFEDIMELVGEDVADKLRRSAGGTCISLPRPSKLTSNSEIARLVGYEDAKRICEAVAPEGQPLPPFYVPLRDLGSVAELRKRVDELLLKDGLSAKDIARKTGVHMRTVYRRRAKLRASGARPGNHETFGGRHHTADDNKAASVVRTLLLEGHSPSLLREILNFPSDVILTIRAELLKQGKL